MLHRLCHMCWLYCQDCVAIVRNGFCQRCKSLNMSQVLHGISSEDTPHGLAAARSRAIPPLLASALRVILWKQEDIVENRMLWQGVKCKRSRDDLFDVVAILLTYALQSLLLFDAIGAEAYNGASTAAELGGRCIQFQLSNQNAAKALLLSLLGGLSVL